MAQDFIKLIGNTPLIRLNGPSEETGCEILGKAEFLNPGGSVKDRAAWYIVKDAIEKGKKLLKHSAGNIHLAYAASCKLQYHRNKR